MDEKLQRYYDKWDARLKQFEEKAGARRSKGSRTLEMESFCSRILSQESEIESLRGELSVTREELRGQAQQLVQRTENAEQGRLDAVQRENAALKEQVRFMEAELRACGDLSGQLGNLKEEYRKLVEQKDKEMMNCYAELERVNEEKEFLATELRRMKTVHAGRRSTVSRNEERDSSLTRFVSWLHEPLLKTGD